MSLATTTNEVDVKVYTITDVTELFQVSRKTATQWLKDGRFSDIDKLHDKWETAPWIISPDAMEEFRLQRIADFDRRIEDLKEERDRLVNLAIEGLE